MIKQLVFAKEGVYTGVTTKSLTRVAQINDIGLKYPELGLLPVCTRYISPYFVTTNLKSNDRNDFYYVMVENRPCMRTVFIADAVYSIPLPWHTFCFLVTKTGVIDNVQLVFSTTSLQDDETIIYSPYLPNHTVDSELDGGKTPSKWLLNFGYSCLGYGNSGMVIDGLTSFSTWYNKFCAQFWGSPFNNDLNYSFAYYSNLKSASPRGLLERLSNHTIDDVLNEEFYYGAVSTTFGGFADAIQTLIESAAVSFFEESI